MTETTFAIADDKSYTCSIKQPKQSNYTCYMFGGDASFSPITWTPQEVEELRYNKQELTKYGREKLRTLIKLAQEHFTDAL
jgi:hypothetical protein